MNKLYYIKHNYISNESTKHEVVIPKNWGLSPQGNQSLTRKAKNLESKLIEVLSSNQSFMNKIKPIDQFVQSYQKSLDSIIMKGAKETMVTESILTFLLEIGHSVGLKDQTIKDIWEHRNR